MPADPHSGSVLRGKLRYHESMAGHVSWRAGGIAERVYVPADLADLALILRATDPGEPVHFVGLGSNLLVRDGGLSGLVIFTHGIFSRVAIELRSHNLPPAPEGDETRVVYAEAGVAAPKLARFAASQGLVGAEFWAGIPGTVGGALAMNAGCYGQDTWGVTLQALTLDRMGQFNERRVEDYVIDYRHVALRAGNEEWFVGGWFRLPVGDPHAARMKIRDLLQRRIDTQPLKQPNCGSVFRNPPGAHAARIIEDSGLKGLRVGGAQVSEKHANFIVNLGDATASDIEALIEKVEDTVEARTNIRLVREVRIIGDRP
jgi:UDP-N-acetylmuramate dehydrogenase